MNKGPGARGDEGFPMQLEQAGVLKLDSPTQRVPVNAARAKLFLPKSKITVSNIDPSRKSP